MKKPKTAREITCMKIQLMNVKKLSLQVSAELDSIVDMEFGSSSKMQMLAGHWLTALKGHKAQHCGDKKLFKRTTRRLSKSYKITLYIIAKSMEPGMVN